MFINRKLKKIGYKRKEEINMKIEDIIKLGEMGYTKAEIEAMQKEPDNDINAQIDSLKTQIENLVNSTQVSNTRETVDEPNNIDNVQDVLNILGGAGDGEK